MTGAPEHYAPPGVAVIGDKGPEIVSLPRAVPTLHFDLTGFTITPEGSRLISEAAARLALPAYYCHFCGKALKRSGKVGKGHGHSLIKGLVHFAWHGECKGHFTEKRVRSSDLQTKPTGLRGLGRHDNVPVSQVFWRDLIHRLVSMVRGQSLQESTSRRVGRENPPAEGAGQ